MLAQVTGNYAHLQADDLYRFNLRSAPRASGNPMNTLDILKALPARLEWVVFFRLAAVARFAPHETLCRMFFMPADTCQRGYSHVVLTSQGRYLALLDGQGLMALDDAPVIPAPGGERSLFDCHAAPLAEFSLEDADCIGIGHKPGGQPAYLHVRLGEHYGEATALLTAEPNHRDYDLLPAIGVDFLGGEQTDSGYRCRFRNRLAGHIKAGELSGFSRTENCNRFFFEQASIDATLADGLKRACADRLGWARATLKAFVHKLSAKAIAGVNESALAMTCIPPPPEPSFAYGDLVPLGLLLRGMQALNRAVEAPALLGRVHDDLVAGRLRRHLEQARTGRLWAFHRGRLVTATDSALILLGLNDPEGCAALELFADGDGGYVPQLWSDHDEPGRMLAHECNAHWRQVDYATTCLIRGLRAEAGLATITPSAYVEAGFDERGGLFFANPYLVDWCVALAIRDDPALVHLADRLRGEVLASANPDGSYGAYDPALSTALAIMVLDALGYRGRALRLAQLRLLELLDAGPWPMSTPFYSTFACAKTDGNEAGDLPSPQHLHCHGSMHALSLYRDDYRIMFAAAVALAVSIDAEVDDAEPQPACGLEAHPRYRCHDLGDYVKSFALPPYVGAERVHG